MPSTTQCRITFALIAASVTGITMTPIAHASRAANTADTPPAQVEQQRRETVRQMRRIGLTAESLAAAGASAGETSVVVERFVAICATLPTSLATAETARRTAERTHATLTARSLRSPWSTMQEDIATAATAVTAARQAEDTLLDLVFDASVAMLPSAVRSRMTLHRENLDNRLPLQLSMTARSSSATKVLTAALVAESNKPGASLDAAFQAALATARSDAEAVAIPTRLAEGGPSVKIAFDAAVAASLTE